MNIFWLDNNVELSAKYHVDKHVVKMILEYAQLLSTAHRLLDGTLCVGQSKSGRAAKRWLLNDDRQNILYNATHINHPSAVWTRMSNTNYSALWCLLYELCGEYTYRYGKVHKVEASGLLEALEKPPLNIPISYFTPPTPAMPDQYKDEDSVKAYRAYYIGDKQRMAKWTKRNKPEWYILNANS